MSKGTAFVLLFLVSGLSALKGVAQNSSLPAGTTLRNISVATNGPAVTIEVETTAPVVPQSMAVEHPDRLVFDFPGCDLLHAGQRIPVNKGAVIAVRASLFRSNPPTARVVVDLKEPTTPVIASEGNKISITIGSSPQSPKENQQPHGRANESPSPDRAIHPTVSSNPSAPPPKAAIPKTRSAYDLIEKARALNIADLQALMAAADKGNADAETLLGLAYHCATLLKKDETEAVRLLTKAAAQNDVAAKEALGIIYATGASTQQPDPEQAIKWYKSAAEQGSVDAATNLATMYATSQGIPKNMSSAVAWFRKAADAGGSAAQYNLALIYERGDGTARDEQQSVYWLTKAADQDVIPALIELADLLAHPRNGSAADGAEAVKRYTRAAELGDPRAQAALGELFSSGTLVKNDYQRSVRWYKAAAEQGNADGQFGLGCRYLLGQGVQTDLNEAFRWFKLAADQGHPVAQYDLGRMYDFGQGTEKDPASALLYYENAAQQDIPNAQYRLGLLLADRATNSTEKVSAYKWLMVAQDFVGQNITMLNDLRRSMSAQEVGEAEREVDAWRTAHQHATR